LAEYLFVLLGIFLAVTVGAAGEYYKQIRKIRREDEAAKEVVGDIVLSFSRQLRRQDENLELVAYKVEAASSKSDRAIKKAEQGERQLQSFASKTDASAEDREKLLVRIGEVDKVARDVIASQKELVARVSAIEKQTQRFPTVSELGVEAVMPIKREKVLAPLTETELSVLETLVVEGPKTAPEIRDRIKLSREHTARLMKKLYEEGYLERDTTKIPFKYRAKKEMKKLLGKTNSGTP
jgi:predicted transcriptional regulator